MNSTSKLLAEALMQSPTFRKLAIAEPSDSSGAGTDNSMADKVREMVSKVQPDQVHAPIGESDGRAEIARQMHRDSGPQSTEDMARCLMGVPKTAAGLPSSPKIPEPPKPVAKAPTSSASKALAQQAVNLDKPGGNTLTMDDVHKLTANVKKSGQTGKLASNELAAYLLGLSPGGMPGMGQQMQEQPQEMEPEQPPTADGGLLSMDLGDLVSTPEGIDASIAELQALKAVQTAWQARQMASQPQQPGQKTAASPYDQLGYSLMPQGQFPPDNSPGGQLLSQLAEQLSSPQNAATMYGLQSAIPGAFQAPAEAATAPALMQMLYGLGDAGQQMGQPPQQKAPPLDKPQNPVSPTGGKPDLTAWPRKPAGSDTAYKAKRRERASRERDKDTEKQSSASKAAAALLGKQPSVLNKPYQKVHKGSNKPGGEGAAQGMGSEKTAVNPGMLGALAGPALGALYGASQAPSDDVSAQVRGALGGGLGNVVGANVGGLGGAAAGGLGGAGLGALLARLTVNSRAGLEQQLERMLTHSAGGAGLGALLGLLGGSLGGQIYGARKGTELALGDQAGKTASWTPIQGMGSEKQALLLPAAAAALGGLYGATTAERMGRGAIGGALGAGAGSVLGTAGGALGGMGLGALVGGPLGAGIGGLLGAGTGAGYGTLRGTQAGMRLLGANNPAAGRPVLGKVLAEAQALRAAEMAEAQALRAAKAEAAAVVEEALQRAAESQRRLMMETAETGTWLRGGTADAMSAARRYAPMLGKGLLGAGALGGTAMLARHLLGGGEAAALPDKTASWTPIQSHDRDTINKVANTRMRALQEMLEGMAAGPMGRMVRQDVVNPMLRSQGEFMAGAGQGVTDIFEEYLRRFGAGGMASKLQQAPLSDTAVSMGLGGVGGGVLANLLGGSAPAKEASDKQAGNLPQWAGLLGGTAALGMGAPLVAGGMGMAGLLNAVKDLVATAPGAVASAAPAVASAAPAAAEAALPWWGKALGAGLMGYGGYKMMGGGQDPQQKGPRPNEMTLKFGAASAMSEVGGGSPSSAAAKNKKPAPKRQEQGFRAAPAVGQDTTGAPWAGMAQRLLGGSLGPSAQMAPGMAEATTAPAGPTQGTVSGQQMIAAQKARDMRERTVQESALNRQLGSLMTPDQGPSAYDLARTGVDRGSSFWATPEAGAKSIYQNMIQGKDGLESDPFGDSMSPEVMQAILAQLRGAGVYR